jgi:N-acetyl-anhydromuramyl-L-alanine amidase AmpD
MTTPLETALAAMDETTRLALDALHRVHDSEGLPPVEIDDVGVLHGDGVSFVPTVRTQKLATPGAEGDRHVEAVVWHYTDTRNAGAVNLAKRIAMAAPEGQERSCHLWIDRAGKIAQSASLERGTWHAGSNTAALFTRAPDGLWRMLTSAQRGKMRGWGANSFAAGIELENVGIVRHVGGQWLGWPFAFGTKHGAPVVVPADEVDADRGLHTFTEAQIAAATRVLAAIVHRYGLTRDACTLTHHAIDPARREDPGDLWTTVHLPKILEAVF